MKSLSLRRTCYLHSHVHYSIIHNSQDMETAKRPLTDEWIKKIWYILFICEEEGNPALCDSIDETGGHFAK